MIGQRKAEVVSKKVEKFGQSLVAHYESGDLCPCIDPRTGYSDPQYHRDNPLEPQCNEDGKINVTPSDEPFKGFVLPIDEEHERLLSDIGTLQKDDHVLYYGGTVDLTEAIYVLFDNQEYNVRNLDKYKVQDIVICQLGIMRLRSNES